MAADSREGRDAVQDTYPGAHLLDVRYLSDARNLHGEEGAGEAPVQDREDDDRDYGVREAPEDEREESHEERRRDGDVEAADEICDHGWNDSPDDAPCIHGRDDVEGGRRSDVARDGVFRDIGEGNEQAWAVRASEYEAVPGPDGEPTEVDEEAASYEEHKWNVSHDVSPRQR